jgi:transposase
LAPFYSSIGRPSIDRELMIRMLLIGYCFGIRSERRLSMKSTSIWRTARFAGWV